MTDICVWCHARFEQAPRRKGGGTPRRYCSDRCVHERQRSDKLVRIERDESPEKWDGKMQLHQTPQRHDYFLTCMACARHVSLKLTDSDTRLIPQQRCQHCGGRMLLEPDAGKAKVGSGTTSDVRAPAAVLPDSRI